MGSGGPGGCRPGIRELPAGKAGLGREKWGLAGLGQMELAALVPSQHLTLCCSQLLAQDIARSWALQIQCCCREMPPCAPQMVRDRNVGMSPLPAVLPSPLGAPQYQLAMNQIENTPVSIKLTRFASLLRETDPSGAARGVCRCLLPLRVSGCLSWAFGFGFDQRCQAIPSSWGFPKPEKPARKSFPRAEFLWLNASTSLSFVLPFHFNEYFIGIIFL